MAEVLVVNQQPETIEDSSLKITLPEDLPTLIYQQGPFIGFQTYGQDGEMVPGTLIAGTTTVTISVNQ